VVYLLLLSFGGSDIITLTVVYSGNLVLENTHDSIIVFFFLILVILSITKSIIQGYSKRITTVIITIIAASFFNRHRQYA
jgi:hypothetical protein